MLTTVGLLSVFFQKTIYNGDLSNRIPLLNNNHILSIVSERCTRFLNHQYRITLSLDPATLTPANIKHVITKQKSYSGIDVDPSVPDLDHCFYDTDSFSNASFL